MRPPIEEIELRCNAASKEPGFSYVVWARDQDAFQKHARQDIPALIAYCKELEEALGEAITMPEGK